MQNTDPTSRPDRVLGFSGRRWGRLCVFPYCRSDSAYESDAMMPFSVALGRMALSVLSKLGW